MEYHEVQIEEMFISIFFTGSYTIGTRYEW
ncbi:hypothetical protein ABIB62_004436 [Mucilaginibacter sp. UYP25]